MEKSLNALVTGASSGIGAAIAKRLAKLGINTAIVGRREQHLLSVKKEIEESLGIAHVIVSDLTESSAVNYVIEMAIQELGDIDILVNCAGAIKMNSILKTPEKFWDLQMNLNVKVPFLLSQKVLKSMRKKKRGWIFNISSEAALDKTINTGAYTISKSALNTLTELISLENRQFNIQAISICPGWVQTESVLDPKSAGLKVEDILCADDIAKYVEWILQQPTHIMFDTIHKILPMNENASLTSSSKYFFNNR